MKYWLLNHKFSNYLEHKDIFGIPVKKDKETGVVIKTPKGNFIPKFSFFNDIKIGDRVVYYCPAPKMVVLGLFKIVDGPGFYNPEWYDNIQYRIEPLYPIEEEKYVSYYDLVENLNFFKDSDGNQLSSRSAAMKLIGTIKEIEENDFNKIVELYTEREPDSGGETTPSGDSLHITMIKLTHLIASQFQCNSFIGAQERNRVYNSVSEEEESLISITPIEDLPSWISDIGKQMKTHKRLFYIDNLWFCEESPGFFIPFAAFEHEKDNNLRSVMDRFTALDKTLKSNFHLKEINPLYFLISKDTNQGNSYRNRISEHGEWREFKNKNKFFVFSMDEIKNRDHNFIQIITEHLITLPFSKRI